MTITIYEGGKKVLEIPDLATLKTIAQAPYADDKGIFKVRHRMRDALREAKSESITQDAALLLKIIEHMRKQGYEVEKSG